MTARFGLQHVERFSPAHAAQPATLAGLARRALAIKRRQCPTSAGVRMEQEIAMWMGDKPMWKNGKNPCDSARPQALRRPNTPETTYTVDLAVESQEPPTPV